jgi:non-heme chloroperoxidase
MAHFSLSTFSDCDEYEKNIEGISFFDKPAGEYGVDKCPIILVHGWLGSWKSWTNILQHLKTHRRVISISLRGWGESEKRGPYSIERYTDDIAAFLHDLEISTYVLCGHSMGALIATSLAARHPHRVEGIVLCGGALKMRQEAKTADGRYLSAVCSEICATLPGGEQAHMSTAGKDFVQILQTEALLQYVSAGKVANAFVHQVLEESYKASVVACREAFQDMLSENHSAELKAITAPALILWGTEDGWFGQDEQDRLRGALENSLSISFREVEGAPHCLIWTHAEECAEIIDDWIDCE